MQVTNVLVRMFDRRFSICCSLFSNLIRWGPRPECALAALPHCGSSDPRLKLIPTVHSLLLEPEKKNREQESSPTRSLIMMGLRRAGTALVRQTRLATSQVAHPAVAYGTAHCLPCRHPFAMSVFLAPLCPCPPPIGRISPVLTRWGARPPRAGRGRGGASATEHERRQARWHHQSSGRYPPPQDRAVVNRLGIGLC